MDEVSNETAKGKRLNAADLGVRASALILVALDVADVETVTIGADVYEFDRADGGVVAGNIAVTAHADDTPANATNALIAKINASGTEPVIAIDLDDNTILIVHESSRSSAIALAETMAGAGNVVDATLLNGEEVNLHAQMGVARVPTANEVTAGAIRIPLDVEPTGAIVQVRTTATGAAVAWDGKVTIDTTNNLLVIDNTGATDFATTDTVNVLLF